MQAWGWRMMVLAVVALPGPVDAQQAPALIAVLPFENSGSYGQDREVFDALQLGLAAMLASTLDRHPGVEVVERGRVNEALAAANLGTARRVDAATAALLAKQVEAHYTVSGSFADFYGKFRINARVVDAQSGKILKVVSNDDPKLQDRAQLAAILHRVSREIAEALGLPSTPSGTPPAIPAEAITDFSRGLLHESRGNRAQALEFYRRAVTASPEYEEARAGIGRVGGN